MFKLRSALLQSFNGIYTFLYCFTYLQSNNQAISAKIHITEIHFDRLSLRVNNFFSFVYWQTLLRGTPEAACCARREAMERVIVGLPTVSCESQFEAAVQMLSRNFATSWRSTFQFELSLRIQGFPYTEVHAATATCCCLIKLSGWTKLLRIVDSNTLPCNVGASSNQHFVVMAEQVWKESRQQSEDL